MMVFNLLFIDGNSMRAGGLVQAQLTVLIPLALVACGHGNAPDQVAASVAPADTYLTALALAPTDVVLQYEQGVRMTWRNGQEQPFGHVPPVTLFADGTVVYTHADTVLTAQLTADEMQALIDHVQALGFDRLATDLDGCRVLDTGVQQCGSEPEHNTIRLRLPSGVLHEVTINGYGGPDPEAMVAIRQFLDAYHHPDARPYQPTAATVLVEQGHAPLVMNQPAPPEQLSEWPLAADWLTPLTGEVRLVVGIVKGDELRTMLAVTTPSMLGRTFRHGTQEYYGVTIVPWLPGHDYHAAITTFTQRPGIAAPASRLLDATPVP